MDADKELARLRDELDRTKALWETAKLEHDRAIERMKDLGVTHPDGNIRQATIAFSYALRNYRTALDEYSRYSLDRMPSKLVVLQGKKKPPTQT